MIYEQNHFENNSYTSVLPSTFGLDPGVVAMWVMTAYGSEVPFRAPATFLSLLPCREISSFIVNCCVYFVE